MTDSVSARVAGALLGAAAGDLLGVGPDGLAVEAAHRSFGKRISGPVVEPQLYSEATQQSAVVAYHLLRHDRIEPGQLGFDFLELARPLNDLGVYRNPSPNFQTVIEHLGAGVAPREAALASAGNGAAVRVAPVAVRFHDDPHGLVEESSRAAVVTHTDPRAIVAAAAAAGAIVAAAHGQSGTGLLHAVLDVAGAAAASGRDDADDGLWGIFGAVLAQATELVGADPAAIERRVGELASSSAAYGAVGGASPYAVASVVTALVIAAPRYRDPYEPVERAAALGGHARGVCSIVGAVVGARLGLARWPWSVPNEALFAELGRRLAGLGPRTDQGLPNLYEVEERLASI